jgi:hypothetical protein
LSVEDVDGISGGRHPGEYDVPRRDMGRIETGAAARIRKRIAQACRRISNRSARDEGRTGAEDESASGGEKHQLLSSML